MISTKAITLQRDKDINNYIDDLKYRYFDNLKYMYYYVDGYITSSVDSYNSWDSDGFKIMLNKNETVGVVLFDINRQSIKCYNLSIMLEEEYLNSGVGPTALKLILEYIFNQRKFRKLKFNVSSKNINARKIYERYEFVTIVGTFKDDYLLYDGSYDDKIVYEIMREDYTNIGFKKRINNESSTM